MKRLGTFILILLFTLGIVQGAFAAAELPKSSVWFDPATAAAGDAIQLNALVYNNQSADATVTVVFTDAAGTIGTTTATIAKEEAKTLSVSWKMPAKDTEVTAKVSTAVNAAKKSLPGLVGPIGTVTVGSTAADSSSFSFPGSAQISKWFGPLISKIEQWRIAQGNHLTALRDTTQKKTGEPTADSTIISHVTAHPGDYLTLAYAYLGSLIFANQALFYIVGILLFLLILRTIVNRFA